MDAYQQMILQNLMEANSLRSILWEMVQIQADKAQEAKPGTPIRKEQGIKLKILNDAHEKMIKTGSI